jgi:phage/plasmid primase-like uncharacterized protein
MTNLFTELPSLLCYSTKDTQQLNLVNIWLEKRSGSTHTHKHKARANTRTHTDGKLVVVLVQHKKPGRNYASSRIVRTLYSTMYVSQHKKRANDRKKKKKRRKKTKIMFICSIQFSDITYNNIKERKKIEQLHSLSTIQHETQVEFSLYHIVLYDERKRANYR